MNSDKELEKEIWIVDDDMDDHELIREIFKDLKWDNPLHLFKKAEELIDQLNRQTHAPFIIISDVNLRGMSGFALREELLKTPDKKCHSVPFIFWATAASQEQITHAYQLRAHGFFIKGYSFYEWKKSLIRIIEYWRDSKMPSKLEQPEAPQL